MRFLIPTIEYIVRRCHEANVKVLLNPAPAAELNPEWLELATYITPNEHELSALYPNKTTEETLLANEKKIIVTLGSKGVGYADDGEIHIVPGFKVEPVDTTGAGDTFNGAFATAIVNGKSLADALHYGNAVAALSIQRLVRPRSECLRRMRSTHSYQINSRELTRTLKAPPAGLTTAFGLRRAKVALKVLVSSNKHLSNNEYFRSLYNKGTMNEALTASFIGMKGIYMQRHGILNSHIAKVLTDLGHTDMICISDCGLPVPEGVQKIDLALEFGVPSFEQVVSLITKHMKIEAIHIAKEMKDFNPKGHAFLESTFPCADFEWITTSHDAFKEATKQCKCIIRTGEASPYANIILRA